MKHISLTDLSKPRRVDIWKLWKVPKLFKKHRHDSLRSSVLCLIRSESYLSFVFYSWPRPCGNSAWPLPLPHLSGSGLYGSGPSIPPSVLGLNWFSMKRISGLKRHTVSYTYWCYFSGAWAGADSITGGGGGLLSKGFKRVAEGSGQDNIFSVRFLIQARSKLDCIYSIMWKNHHAPSSRLPKNLHHIL